MFVNKVILSNEVFKCRLCKTGFASPEELRLHRMNAHKGHMLNHKN